MSFGVMPTWEAFHKAFIEELGVDGLYEITAPCGNPDRDVMHVACEKFDVDKWASQAPASEPISGQFGEYRDAWNMDAWQTWCIVQILRDLDASEVSDDLPEDHNPEYLASAIMDTLGFEWI